MGNQTLVMMCAGWGGEELHRFISCHFLEEDSRVLCHHRFCHCETETWPTGISPGNQRSLISTLCFLETNKWASCIRTSLNWWLPYMWLTEVYKYEEKFRSGFTQCTFSISCPRRMIVQPKQTKGHIYRKDGAGRGESFCACLTLGQ